MPYCGPAQGLLFLSFSMCCWLELHVPNHPYNIKKLLAPTRSSKYLLVPSTPASPTQSVSASHHRTGQCTWILKTRESVYSQCVLLWLSWPLHPNFKHAMSDTEESQHGNTGAFSIAVFKTLSGLDLHIFHPLPP